MAEHVTIPGAPDNPYLQRDGATYDYARSPCLCGACGRDAAGMPWRGWMRCDYCGGMNLVDGGSVFVPVKEGERDG